MTDILTFLSNLVYSEQVSLLIAGAFIWGIVSVIFSPCHLTGIPLLVGYMTNYKLDKISKTLKMTTIFSIAVLCSIILIGIITGNLGMLLGDLGLPGEIFLILLLIYFGLSILGFVPLFPGIKPKADKKNYFSMFIAGFLFGISLGPCTFAFMAPVLGVFLQKINSEPITAYSLILSFGLGHSLVIIVFGTFFERLNFLQKKASFGLWIKKFCGIIILFYAIIRVKGLF